MKKIEKVHIVRGFAIVVKDGNVVSCSDPALNFAVNPFRWSKAGWAIDNKLSLAALRAGIRRNTIIIR